uniref:Putative metastriate insulin growth factor binding protein n=1 Tax=Hyalomma excavatum TaxID=257692 RepID=A0A131XN06_9ACAR
MKIAFAFLLVAFAAVCVYATSPPNCEGVTCDPETCAKHECRCGTHKDACGCCDFCNKCVGEECHPEHNDHCEDGSHCVVKVVGEPAGPVPGHCEAAHESTSTAKPDTHVHVPDSEAPVEEHHEHHEGTEHAKTEEHHE